MNLNIPFVSALGIPLPRKRFAKWRSAIGATALNGLTMSRSQLGHLSVRTSQRTSAGVAWLAPGRQTCFKGQPLRRTSATDVEILIIL